MLHTVNKSPFEKNSLETCLRLSEDNSSILLIEDGVIEGFFMSAWSPPTNAFETYSLNNPEVSIEHRYYEGGNDYCGRNGDERSGLPKHDDPLWDQDDVLKECDMEFGIRESMRQWEDEE